MISRLPQLGHVVEDRRRYRRTWFPGLAIKIVGGTVFSRTRSPSDINAVPKKIIPLWASPISGFITGGL
jgi:hypothetical protein